MTFFPKHTHSLVKIFSSERIPVVFFFQLWQLRSEVLVHSIVYDTSVSNLLQTEPSAMAPGM